MTSNVSAPTVHRLLPAAALMRETSLVGSHVVISFSRRRISAVAASKSARSRGGVERWAS